MRRIKLKPLAPPLSELHAVLRIDVPIEYREANWSGTTAAQCRIGKVPENCLEDADETQQMLDFHEADLGELIEGDGVTWEVVLVDENNQIWSYLEGEREDDESRPTLFDD